MSVAKKVSIGIPVYNEIKFIENTLRSVMLQDADQVIISDNASTDGTSEVCREFAEKYKHIKYFRYDTVQKVEDNFQNCVDLADNEYFMIMGGHDLLSRNYVSELRALLDTKDCVGAYTNSVHLSHEYAFKYLYQYDFRYFLQHKDAHTRVFATIEHLGDCTIYYGLYKKDVFVNAYKICKELKFNGLDHAVLSQIAAQGRMIFCPTATFFRIDPPRKEVSQFEKWERVLQAQYGNSYDAKVHIPELIPLGIAYAQFHIAQSVADSAPNRQEYLANVVKMLFDRWAVNDRAFTYILRELKGAIRANNLRISF